MTKSSTATIAARTATTDLRAVFGFHAVPFTREIGTDDHFALPFLDEALSGLLRAVEDRMSAALIAPAGTGKTALLRLLRAALPEARYQVHYVKVTGPVQARHVPRDRARLRRHSRRLLPDAGAAPARALRGRRSQRGAQARAPARREPGLASRRPRHAAPAHQLRHGQPTRPLGHPRRHHGAAHPARPRRSGGHRPPYHLLRAAPAPVPRRDRGLRRPHRCAVAGAATVPFDERTLDALFEIGRGNLRATDDLALKSLEHAAAAGLATVSVQHVVAARKDILP